MLDALWITLLGMATIYASLGAVLLVMVALGKMFKPRKEVEEEAEPES